MSTVTNNINKNLVGTTLFNFLQANNDGNGILDLNGNLIFGVYSTAGAVNGFSFTNAATGNAPALSVTGTDPNIDMLLESQGTGALNVNGYFKLPISSPTMVGQTIVATGTGANATTSWGTGGGGGGGSASVNVQTFTTSGTYTPSAGISYATIQVVGGGGGGGGEKTASVTRTTGTSGGGGGGGYAQLFASASQIGTSPISVTVGTGGAAGVGGTPTAGGTGNTSTLTLGGVGTITIAATGGVGGAAATASGASYIAAGGTGGTGSGGGLNIAGSTGGAGANLSGYLADGATPFITCNGGASALSGSCVLTPGSGFTSAGVNGLVYGGGGTGALVSNSGASQNGGAGAAGIVIITEYVGGGGGSSYAYTQALWVDILAGSDTNAGTSIDTPLLTFQAAITLAGTTPTTINFVNSGVNTETVITGSGIACDIVIVAPAITFNGSYTFQNAGDVYTWNAFEVNNVTDSSTNQNTVNCQSINGTTDNSGGMIINASYYINTYAYSGATGTVYLTAPSISATFSPSNTVTAYIEADSLFSFTSVFGASASNYYINATNCPSFSQTGADNFFTNIAVGTPSAGGGAFFGNFGGINYGTSGLGDGTGTIQSYWPATGPSASGQTIISGGAGPGATTSWGAGGGGNVAYVNTYWVDQSNGSDSNAGTSINTPFLTVQAAVTAAGTTQSMIYVVDSFQNNENITTAAGCYILLDAPGTVFNGIITIASAGFMTITGDTLLYLALDTSAESTILLSNSIEVSATLAGGNTLYVTAAASISGVTSTGGGNFIYLLSSYLLDINVGAGDTAYIQTANWAGASNVNAGTIYSNVPTYTGSPITNTGNIYGIIGQEYYALNAITDSVGNNVLTFTDTPSAVNYINITNADTGLGAAIGAVGSDTDVRLVLASQGMGVIDIIGGDLVSPVAVMSFTPVASGVNYFDTYSAATGDQPQILARGSDTNISMSLGAKGNGGVYTQGSTAGTLPTSGYVGEIISSNIPVGTPVALTSGMTINVTSINLTAGNWRLTGNVNAQGATNSFGTLLVAINSTSATFPDQSYINAFVSSVFTYSNIGLTAPDMVVSPTTTTTYYLIAFVSSVSAVTGCGNLIATRLP